MADTTGRILLWIIGTVTGILVIGFRRTGFEYPHSANQTW